MRRPVLLIMALVLIAAPLAFAAPDLRTSARADLIAAIQSYRAALERLAEFHVASVGSAAAEV